LHFDVEAQLRELLGRAEIWSAIGAHRAYLRRDGRPAGLMEDIQDGQFWKTMEKDGKLFLEHEGGIGLILMCDWFVFLCLDFQALNAYIISQVSAGL
jgi:hypothetical protein